MKNHITTQHISIQWRTAFDEFINRAEHANALKESSNTASLKDWTSTLSTIIFETCRKMKWYASGKGHRTRMLPVSKNKYLDIDVTAFAERPQKWQFPIAVFELEEQQKYEYIAYNLWKLLCIRVNLRVLFCYQPSAKNASSLMHYLSKEVIHALPDTENMGKSDDNTLVIIGSNGNAEAFPLGYFTWWQLDKERQKFRVI